MHKRALVIGRFQPFHNGHRYLLLKALEIAENVVIGIGSSNRIDVDNPFSFKQREKMLQEFIRQEKIEDKIIKIVPIPDVPDDNAWLTLTKQKVGTFDVSVGNNSWVNSIFKKGEIPVKKVPYYKRYLLEGQKIRKLLKSGRKWENRVPDYLIDNISRLYSTTQTPFESIDLKC